MKRKVLADEQHGEGDTWTLCNSTYVIPGFSLGGCRFSEEARVSSLTRNLYNHLFPLLFRYGGGRISRNQGYLMMIMETFYLSKTEFAQLWGKKACELGGRVIVV